MVGSRKTWRWLSVVLAVFMSTIGLWLFASAPAHAEIKTYSLTVDNNSATAVQICLGNETDMPQRSCTKMWYYAGDAVETLSVPWDVGKQSIWLDYEVQAEHTHDDNNVTGATHCELKGPVLHVELKCDYSAEIEGHYKVDVDNKMGNNATFCFYTTSTLKTKQPVCSPELEARKTATVVFPYGQGEDVYLEFKMNALGVDNGQSIENNVITGGHQCTAEGILNAAKVDCHTPDTGTAPTFEVPDIDPYEIDVSNHDDPAMKIIDFLSYMVSACGVVGIILTGISLALQLKHGEPGEFAGYLRGAVWVFGACILALSAGPVIGFFLH